MTNSINSLTEKIYNEGILKADREAERIITAAKKEAEEMINAARNESGRIIEQAKADADDVKKKADSEIRLAAQKLISNLKQQVAGMLVSKQVDSFADEAFNDDEFVKEMLLMVMQNWTQRNSDEQELSLSVPPMDEKKMNRYFESKLIKQLHKGLEIKIDPNIKNGFKIGPKDGNYIISFTEKDFENYFKTYLKEKTREFIFGSQ